MSLCALDVHCTFFHVLEALTDFVHKAFQFLNGSVEGLRCRVLLRCGRLGLDSCQSGTVVYLFPLRLSATLRTSLVHIFLTNITPVDTLLVFLLVSRLRSSSSRTWLDLTLHIRRHLRLHPISTVLSFRGLYLPSFTYPSPIFMSSCLAYFLFLQYLSSDWIISLAHLQ